MKLMTVTQAAAGRGVGKTTIRLWIARGWLPAQRIGARLWLIEPAALAACHPPPAGYPVGRPRKANPTRQEAPSASRMAQKPPKEKP